MRPDNLAIYVVANSITSSRSMSGGDKLFIEWSRRWALKGFTIKLLLCDDGLKLCVNNGLSPDICHLISNSSAKKFGVIPSYGFRIIESIASVLRLRSLGRTAVYSSSDFLTDIFPGLLLKLTRKSSFWVCGFYLRCPNPFRGEVRYTLRSLSYYFSQLVTVMLAKTFVDLIFALTPQDKRYLESMGIESEKIEVVNGGVDMAAVSSLGNASTVNYHGCFVGRFHHQKGIPDLIRAWELVCKTVKDARLAIVGWGDKEYQNWMVGEISKRGLAKNVALLGFLDGKEKFTLMKSSEVFLFPSNHESWPIVVCEAMACGLSVVAYDLPEISEVLKKGLWRVKLGDIESFAKAVIDLLQDRSLRDALGQDARRIASQYDWANSADAALNHITAHVR